jgi:PAS domain S-box-containing protein
MKPDESLRQIPRSICTRARTLLFLGLGLAGLVMLVPPLVSAWQEAGGWPGWRPLLVLWWPQLMSLLFLFVGTHFLFSALKNEFHTGLEVLGLAIPAAMQEGKPVSPANLPWAELYPLIDPLNRAGVFQALHEAEERALQRERDAQSSVRQVLNSVSDAVLLLDGNNVFIWGNRRVDPVLGGARRVLIGQKAEVLAPDEEASLDLQTHLLLAWRGKPQFFEWSCLRPNGGGRTPCEVYVERVNLPGADILCLSLRDLSKRKEDEIALRDALDEVRVAKERAEAATAQKSLFLARMTHEIRTPMHAITGISHLAQRKAGNESDAAEFRRIHLAGQRLLRIINDILDFSKLEAGKVALEIKPFSLEELEHSLTDLLSMRLMGKDVELRVERAPGTSPYVSGDSLRVHQILLNLLDNAIKFTEKGEVWLRMQPGAAPGNLRFEIQDEGIGLTEEQQSRLFQSYEQAETGTARKFGGTGLGLSICQKLAEVMDGAIGAHSSPGGGSTFWVELPLPPVSRADWERLQITGENLHPQLGGKKILVVDDNEINREIARGLLSEMRCEVFTAEGGEEALGLLRSQTFDLVLVDLEMPGMDGFALAREVRADAKLSHLPLVAMTAHVLGETRPLAAAAGLNGYLTKPIDMDLLRVELLRFLNPGGSKLLEKGEDSKHDELLKNEDSTPQNLVRVDKSSALKLLGGNEEIYQFMARRFCETWDDVREKFSAAPDFSAKRRLAHTLKGLCASLGCQDVADQAGSIEADYAREIEPNAAELDALLSRVLALRLSLLQNT